MTTPHHDHDTPPELRAVQQSLETLARHDRDDTPDALIDSIASMQPPLRSTSPVILARIRPALALAAALAVLATAIVLLTPSTNTSIPDDPESDLIATLEDDSPLFDDDFEASLALLESELQETELLLASWDADQLWEDSQTLWQEVVQ
ncbi:MAG: hypothetical protein ACF8GE_04415 [Phycisphaerales bacterium JB043]